MAKARKHKKEPPKLYPINISKVKDLLSDLRKEETKPKTKDEIITCLEDIFDNIYGNVLVCKPPSGGGSGPGCGVC